MVLKRLTRSFRQMFRASNAETKAMMNAMNESHQNRNLTTHFRSGALKPKPLETPFGLLGIVCAVVPGLFVGAMISKNVANFLEENDLFVPSDDDDDDD